MSVFYQCMSQINGQFDSLLHKVPSCQQPGLHLCESYMIGDLILLLQEHELPEHHFLQDRFSKQSAHRNTILYSNVTLN